MTRFLFWNYRYDGHDKEELLGRLILAEMVDVVILAESMIDRESLLDRLKAAGRPYSVPRIPHPNGRIEVLAGYPSDCFIDWARDQDRMWLRRFRVPGRVEILLGAVHLISGVHRDRLERRTAADAIARAVREAQREVGICHERTIIVGDFNLNPYDDGMIFPSGFGAMMTKDLVRKQKLSHGGGLCGRFYNPLWSRLGREITEAPPGTYYWNENREFNIYWNCIDQVLIGADLLDYFPTDRLRILTAIPGPEGPRSLIRETPGHWKIEISDHLPLIFDVDLPPEATDNG
jgi:hypothetical protein